MKTTTLQIESITGAELLNEIEAMLEKSRPGGDYLTPSDLKFLTKEQAAEVLRGSTAFIDSLIAQAELQPFFPYKNRPSTIRFRTADVLKLKAQGKTGRK